MNTKRIISRKQKRNQATIILELKGEMKEELKKEIIKAIHKWNHLLGNELSHKILVIEHECNCQEERRSQ